MSKKRKITVIVAAAVLLAAAVAAAAVTTAATAAEKAGDKTRKELQTAFLKNLSAYDDMVQTLHRTYTHEEYCILLDDEAPLIDISYADERIDGIEILAELKSFSELTGTDVIYVSPSGVYFKTEFVSGLGRKSEANFIFPADSTPPPIDGSAPIADSWYYAELVIE